MGEGGIVKREGGEGDVKRGVKLDRNRTIDIGAGSMEWDIINVEGRVSVNSNAQQMKRGDG